MQPEGPGLRITILRDTPFDPAARFAHKYGGRSLIVDPLPACSACRRPLKLSFEFDMRDPLLSFLELPVERFPILTCCDCDLSYAGNLFYVVEPRRIQVLSSDATQSFQAWDTSFPESSIQIAPVPVEQRPDTYESEDAWDEAIRFAHFAKHQLGGKLLLVQDEHEMPCPRCNRNMQMLGQVDSETWNYGEDHRNHGHMFGDMGILYVGFCRACGIFGTGGECY